MSTAGPYLRSAERNVRQFSYRMFEINMDEYLDEEIESVKQTLDSICKSWDKQVRHACFKFGSFLLSDYNGRRLNKPLDPLQPASSHRTIPPR